MVFLNLQKNKNEKTLLKKIIKEIYYLLVRTKDYNLVHLYTNLEKHLLS